MELIEQNESRTEMKRHRKTYETAGEEGGGEGRRTGGGGGALTSQSPPPTLVPGVTADSDTGG